MIDVAEALPDDKAFMKYEDKDYYINNYQKSAYFAQFVDMENHTCDFENETFYRFLNYIASLPDEANNTSNGPTSATSRVEEAAILEVLFEMHTWQLFSWEYPDGYEIVGYPNDDGMGSYIVYRYGYVITQHCKDVSSAWEFVHGMLTKDFYSSDDELNINNYVPIFKTLYDRVGQKIIARQEELKNDESKSHTNIYAMTTLTQEDFDNMWEFLDTKVNGALYDIMPDELFNIITDEISSFTHGVGTAEQCAKKIQSRTSI